MYLNLFNILIIFFFFFYFQLQIHVHLGFIDSSVGKESTCNAEDTGDRGLLPRYLGQEDLLEGKWQPTPVFLPGKSHVQRTLMDYSPWDHKESDHTQRLNTHTHTHTRI